MSSEKDERGTVRVAVAVLTYQRPEALHRALASIQPQLREITPEATLIVVDNDPSGGAAPLVKTATTPGASVRYVHEPRPGISAARNAALDAAVEFDVLLFMDDDEIATEGWLAQLVDCWRERGGAAVTGPVEPIFTGSDAQTWIARTGVFTRLRRPTGHLVEGFATNNLLLDLSFLRAQGLQFADELGLVGGEDTLLSRQIVAQGGQIRWCDEAVVTEVVIPERLSGRWVRRRAFRSGASWAHAVLAVTAPPQRGRQILRMWARAAIRVPVGLVQWFVGTAIRHPRLAGRGSNAVFSLSGALWGARGGSVREYRRPTTATG